MSAPTATGSLREQGTIWVTHILSGRATRGDAAALAAWRALSPSHDRAYLDALRLLRSVEQAGLQLRREEAAREAAGTAQTVPPGGMIRSIATPVNRRWMLAGGVAGVAGLALGLSAITPAEAGQFTTGIGERRRLAVAPGLIVEMNTESSLSVERSGAGHQVRLLRGQAMVAAALAGDRQVIVLARDGRSVAQQARFDVRDYDRRGICVTCAQGRMTVEQGGASRRLVAAQSVTYSAAGIAEPVKVDSDTIMAWQQGMLVFRNQPLRTVIAEVNRYRRGRIWIATESLASQSVDAVFYLDRMQDVVPQVQQLSGARATSLPGGIVILS